MPLLFSTGVRSTTPKVLFSSLLTRDITSAPVIEGGKIFRQRIGGQW